MTTNDETKLREEITRLSTAAKELVTITALLQGIFFAVISIGDIRRLVQQWELALFILPLILWLLCLIFAMLAFMPSEYYNNSEGKWALLDGVRRLLGRYRSNETKTRQVKTRTELEILQSVSDRKFLRLRLAYAMLWISLAFLLFDICLYFFALPPPQTPCLPICSTPAITPSP